MKTIKTSDLDFLALGAKILGSGGGGNPQYALMIAKQLHKDLSEIPLFDVEEIADDALVAPLCYMGAPLVGIEKIPGGDEFVNILEQAENLFHKKIDYILTAEIGGGNALTPFTIPKEKDYKILDADLIGRAFPELQMCSGNLHQIPGAPAFLSDFIGNTAIVNAKYSKDIEKLCRAITVCMGSRAAIGFHFMSGKDAKKAVVKKSITRALEIGKVMIDAKSKGEDCVAALIAHTMGRKIASGVISDISQKIERGFLNGKVMIQEGEQNIQVWYQNEYLAIFQDDLPLASTPDIIMLFETETGTPITSESLTYGQRIELVAIPAPDIWKTQRGLELVGPMAFKYDIDFQKIMT
jgi:DUF917 family protein